MTDNTPTDIRTERWTAQVLLAMADTGRRVTDSVRTSGAEQLLDNSTMVAALLMWMHGPLRPGQVAEMMGMTTGGSTKVVDRLESQGWVVRQQGPSFDGRAVVVTLTEEGRSVIRSAIHASAEAIDAFMAELGSIDVASG